MMIRKLSNGLVVAAALGAAAGAHGAMTFAPQATLPVGQQPSGIASGDFNGDGRPDLAITSDNPDKVTIFVGAAGGVFSPAGVTFLPSGSGAGDLVAARLDAGATVDLAIALQNSSAVLILAGNGAGGFTSIGTVQVGLNPRGIVVGDANGDGIVDLAVANRDANSVSVLTGSGTGAFSAVTLAAGAEPRGVAFVASSAGLPTLAATNHDDRTISIYSNSNGVFSPAGTLSVGANLRPEGIDSADMNGDGSGDLVVASNGGNGTINFVQIYLRSGATFSGPTNFSSGGLNVTAVATGDLDCDGRADVIASNQDSNNLAALGNLGGGALGAPQLLAVGVNPERPIVTKLDGDFDLDVAVANRNSNTASVVLNRTCRVPGDLNADDRVNEADLGILLQNWYQGAGGDANGDGQTDESDLGMILTNWRVGD